MMARAKTETGDGEGGKLDFEASMKRLETIVEELEAGELTLEDSIARYEEGMKLSKWLTQRLDEAEKRVERLVGSGEEGGPPSTEPMDLELKGGELPEGELPF